MNERTKGTVLYGASDDLIEFEGDVYDEVGFYNSGDEEKPALVVFSDGTLATIAYGKADLAIWSITVINKGALFDRVETCENEDDDRHSDQLFLKPGINHVYVATEWQGFS